MTSQDFARMDDGGGPTYGPSGLSYATLSPGYEPALLPSSRVAGSDDINSGLYTAPMLWPEPRTDNRAALIVAGAVVIALIVVLS